MYHLKGEMNIMLLNIYLGTTGINWAVLLLYSNNYIKGLEKKGYKFVKDERPTREIVAELLSLILTASIPGFNILTTVGFIYMDDKIFEYLEKKMLEDGKIYIPTKEKKVNEEPKINTNSIEKTQPEEKHSEMDIDEKIAYLKHEKEILTNEFKTQANPHQNQQGITLAKTISTK